VRRDVEAGRALSEDELRVHLQTRLANFKVPTRVSITSSPLPRNAAGKFVKRESRDLLPLSRGDRRLRVFGDVHTLEVAKFEHAAWSVVPWTSWWSSPPANST